MCDNTLSYEDRFVLYLSSRYLQELDLALRLAGIRAWYLRPGIAGIALPLLYIAHPESAEIVDMICAIPKSLDDRSFEWWFEWRSREPNHPDSLSRKGEAICRIGDMSAAAGIIACQLREKPHE